MTQTTEIWWYVDRGVESGPFTAEEAVELDGVRTAQARYTWRVERVEVAA